MTDQLMRFADVAKTLNCTVSCVSPMAAGGATLRRQIGEAGAGKPGRSGANREGGASTHQQGGAVMKITAKAKPVKGAVRDYIRNGYSPIPGFMVSFGTDSPFDPDDPIRGGGKKQVTTKAVTPGCYKYDAGAFRSGTVYGMSGGSKPELVILP